MITDDMRMIVEQAMLSFVATVRPDGAPNLSPKGSLRVYDDQHLIFMDIASPNTMRNLAADPRVEVNTIDVFRRRGYRFTGTATIVPPGAAAYEELKDWLLALNGPGYPANEAVLIRVEQALPILSPAYDFGAAEEEQLRSSWSGRYAAVHGSGR
ncbi:pyridoxamine 5'-phosphate oxidase family protein [Streptomyces cadmiisoli]|uniref:Pyridoxamine 5'-phosphate oxidase family protein n=1 Tax=Streptomyces cadmiisoli TaxID=2184053 RepID=A0A2Z4J989_9ACTN|nr:pyridoxamine 5'-phosphate oxidase family protein [Streptomyces cadmiisoli]AWW41570.1 pyridoxamine 5'-phosphate oxidase family protein [Streptomyces cadmiisoli]